MTKLWDQLSNEETRIEATKIPSWKIRATKRRKKPEGALSGVGIFVNRVVPRPGVGVFRKRSIEFADDETLGSALERRG